MADSKFYNNTATDTPERSDEFTVSKIKPYMDTSSPTIKKGNVGKITVTVPKDATGKVTVEIEGKNYTADVKDGKAVFNIPGLSEGKHNFKAYYSGDDKYYPSEIDGCIEFIENSTHDSDDNKTSEKHNQDKVNDSVKMNNPVKMHPTGNPMLMLLFALIILGTYPLRKFRK